MKRLSARKYIESELEAGKAIRYIHCFDELQPGDKVYLVCRKSGRERRDKLVKQEKNLRRIAAAKGAVVVDIFRYVGSGFDPYWLIYAAADAKRKGAKWLLAESTDRLIRNVHYHSNDAANVHATEEDLQRMAKCVGDTPLMTHLHPDATPSEVRSYQRIRGGGGRPRNRKPGYKKRHREKSLLRVVLLWRIGLSLRQIERKTGVNYRTADRWCKKDGRSCDIF